MSVNAIYDSFAIQEYCQSATSVIYFFCRPYFLAYRYMANVPGSNPSAKSCLTCNHCNVAVSVSRNMVEPLQRLFYEIRYPADPRVTIVYYECHRSGGNFILPMRHVSPVIFLCILNSTFCACRRDYLNLSYSQILVQFCKGGPNRSWSFTTP